MPEQRAYLFIGGPKDGQRYIPREALPVLKFERLAESDLSAEAFTKIPEASFITLVQYRLVTIICESGLSISFYAMEGLTQFDALEMLMERYTPKPTEPE